MIFTDDAKEALEQAVKEEEEFPFCDYCETIKALLTRLEAAEKAIHVVENGGPTVEIDAYLETWRKAAGK